MARITMFKAVEPLVLEFVDGEEITVEMDLRDETMAKALNYALTDGQKFKLDNIEAMKDPAILEEMANHFRDVIVCVIGADAYDEILKHIGDGVEPREINMYMVNVYMVIIERATKRHEITTKNKQAHYFREIAGL